MRWRSAKSSPSASGPPGWKFTLPTEAQWEYACRAGTTGDYAGDLDAMGWYRNDSDGQTHEVATKQANAWGLFDMHSNIWERCLDFCMGYPRSADPAVDPTGPPPNTPQRNSRVVPFDPGRVVRGGGWSDPAETCRSAYRAVITQRNRDGFGREGAHPGCFGFPLALAPTR